MISSNPPLKGKAPQTLHVDAKSTDLDLSDSMDWLQNRDDAHWSQNFEHIAQFLIIAKHYITNVQLLGRLQHQTTRLLNLLEGACEGCGACSEDCKRRHRVINALRSCAHKSWIQPSSHKRWVPQSLNSTGEILALMKEIDQLMEGDQLKYDHLDFLPLSLREALEQPKIRHDFCPCIRDNPALKGHLIDLYRACRDASAGQATH